MAPMIDMVFLLLVFFMCVSTLAQAEKQAPVELPESERSKVADDLSGRGTISVGEDGTVFMGTRRVELEDLKRRIQASLRENPDLRIQLRADRKTAFTHMRKVLRACAEAGAYEIIFSTHQTG